MENNETKRQLNKQTPSRLTASARRSALSPGSQDEVCHQCEAGDPFEAELHPPIQQNGGEVLQGEKAMIPLWVNMWSL